MTSSGGGGGDTRAANDLDVIQDMIAISADRLEGLRTQCATSATLTQQEIRCLETKLVRMFSELLLTKERLNERIPASGLPPLHTMGNELKQWLRVVGLSNDTLAGCLSALTTLEQLLEQNDDELRRLIQANNPNYREEEVRRLTKAMQNLKKCKEFLNSSGSDSSSSYFEQHGSKEHLLENLYWDSWDRHHHHHHHHHRGSVGNIGIMSSPRTHRVFMKQAARHGSGGQQSPSNDSSSRTNLDDSASLPGSSPPGSMFAIPGVAASAAAASFMQHGISSSGGGGVGGIGGGSLNGTPVRGKAAGTPPPLKKHQTLLNNQFNQSMTPTHHCVSIAANNSQTALDKLTGGSLPLSKSKSNESQFHDPAHSPPSLKSAAHVVLGGGSNSMRHTPRTHADPSPDSYSSASSDILESSSGGGGGGGGNNNNNNLQVPRSPCTPLVQPSALGMGHQISHRFTKVFKMMSTCDLCQKQMFFGLKCKECKYRCHKDCESNVPPSCGLPREFVDEFKKTLQDQQAGFHALGGGGHANNQSSVNTSPNLNTLSKRHTAKRLHNKPTGQSTNPGADSSSAGSSCNSSGPSSPALLNLLQQQHNSTLASAVGGTNCCIPGAAHSSSNIMNSSGGGSSSTSSNMLSTPSSFHKNSSQFNFPDVTVTPNCNLDSGGSSSGATHTLYSSQSSNNDLESITSPPLQIKETTYTMPIQQQQQQGNVTTSASGEDGGATTASAVAVAAGSLTSSINSSSSTIIANSMRTGSGTHSAVTMSMVSTHSGTFYPRKLSSAGVDKRDLTDTYKSNDSDKTVSLSESTSASTDSDRTPVRLDSTEDADSGHWPRQNSLSAKEWDIPYDDLRLLEQIGQGRFGTVHRALWHGPVAVKLLKEDYLHDERMLEAFRLEVANFKKTRHENLVLFMGACMNPPYLAIVTSLCKGNTLYTYIHIRRDKFTINKTTLVAQQISQGMGYLHARGIVHKDLRTKNIFLENGKVIITDFGLFSSTKLNYCDTVGLCVPNGWLCYMSPELMRALLPTKPSEEVLPFTKASDVYSFGTVWYELLCGEFPFRTQPPESIIWQVGRGMKQTLANLHTSRDVKDILMLCWSFQADDRPDFQRLLNLLEKLPKKRLARSPSHPVQFTSRSAESVF